MSIQEYNAKIIERTDLTSDLCILKVAFNEGPIPPFQAGQFATLGLFGKAPRLEGCDPDPIVVDPEKIIRRAYSIASSPLQNDHLEFYLTLVKNGVLTPRLWNLNKDDPVFLGNKITGQFVLSEIPENQNLVFVATGTGIAPYVSMLRTIYPPPSAPPLIRGAGGIRERVKIAVFHGVRTSQDLGYRDELEELQKTNPNFAYFPIISRPQNDTQPWAGYTGHVQKLWEEKVIEKKL